MAGAVQVLAGILLLVALWLRRRQPVYAAWALAFGWVVADDILALHERGGSALVEAWALPAPFGFDPQYLGEALVWALVGPVLILIVVLAHRRAEPVARRHSKLLLAAAGVLVFFAVGVDTLATLVERAPPIVRTLVVLTETTGELLAMTLMLACVFWMTRAGPRGPRATRPAAPGAASAHPVP